MKMKKYTARTEQEAIEMVKNELGLSALILNIKKIQPRGLFAFLRKPTVEVTAAYEESGTVEKSIPKKPELDTLVAEQQEKIRKLEQDLSNKEELLEKVIWQLSASSHNSISGERRYENNMVQVFYDTLVGQGVTEEIATEILKDINLVDDSEEIDINLIVKIVYNTIINILGEPSVVDVKGANGPSVIFFIGPTGVGKTTTIAKLSSLFVLEDNAKLGLITADTYRIAAVEQLKTYAEILAIDVGVVYNSQDLETCFDKMRGKYDLILIDTAGRSHKNSETVQELSDMLSIIPDSEKYLVLSLTTRYEDLIQIIKTYSGVTDFKLIFTKLDEAGQLGVVLNICYLTKKKISYITNGQNVPDDISTIKPEQIARALLNLGSGGI